MVTLLDTRRSPRLGLRGSADDLSILLVAVIWGSTYVAMQVVGKNVPAAPFLMLRFVWALPALAIPASRTLRKVTRDELRTGVFFGAMLFGILILETVGVRHTSAANAGFLITVSTVLIPLLERVISKRRQLPVVYLMTLAAFVGCGLLLLSNGVHPQVGDFIILGAAVIRATQITLFGRRSGGVRQSLVNLTVIEFVTVVILSALLSLIGGVEPWRAAAAVSMHDWVLIAYLGVFGTSFAFFAQLRAARAASSTRVGLILSTEPVFSTFFAVSWGGDSLGVLQVLGGALVVLSAGVGRAFEGRAPGSATASASPRPSEQEAPTARQAAAAESFVPADQAGP
jgi:drug/metabolite transporter (DMT)-like permease